MAQERYQIGDMVRLIATFTVANVPANPTTVTFRVLPPGGEATTITGTSGVMGTYTAEVAATKAGIWRYRVEGTGAAQAAAESTFYVEPSAFVVSV